MRARVDRAGPAPLTTSCGEREDRERRRLVSRLTEREGDALKVFVAGATGALGKQLVPQLVARGHEVVGMTRTASKQEAVRALGARPVVADALEPDAVARAVAEAEPEVVVHQLTALSGALDLRHLDRVFAMTNRLRTEGVDHLLAAARAVGVRRFVAQSYAGWPFVRTGGPAKSETDPLDPDPPEALRSTLAAIRHLEQAVTGVEWAAGVVLRNGGFYGPGTGLSLEPHAAMAEAVRRRRFPLIGGGGGVWSFRAHRRRRCGDRSVRRARLARHLPDRRRRARGRARVAPGARQRPRRQAAAAPPVLARAARGRRGGDRHDDRGAGSREREGEARPRLAAGLPELAPRLRARTRLSAVGGAPRYGRPMQRMAVAVTRRGLHDLADDLAYWLAQQPADRVAAVEAIRTTHHGWDDATRPRLRRVSRVVARP